MVDMYKEVRAMIWGHAVGDALGVPVEFESRENLAQNPVAEMRGYGSYDVPAGSWSDDTSMTLALMESMARLGRVGRDKKKTAVLLEDMSRSMMISHIIELLKEEAITLEDLEGFSDNLRERLKFLFSPRHN